jgi:hypothetical protein
MRRMIAILLSLTALGLSSYQGERLKDTSPPAPALIMPQARDAAAAPRLWDVSGQLTGTSFE